MKLGDQFARIVTRKAEELGDVAVEVMEEINEKAGKNTEASKGFGNDIYESDLSPAYKKKSGKDFADMRGFTEEIENTFARKSGKNKAVGGFVNTGSSRIFRYHHEGIATGGKIRSIYPKSAESVPGDIKNLAQKLTKKALEQKNRG